MLTISGISFKPGSSAASSPITDLGLGFYKLHVTSHLARHVISAVGGFVTLSCSGPLGVWGLCRDYEDPWMMLRKCLACNELRMDCLTKPRSCRLSANQGITPITPRRTRRIQEVLTIPQLAVKMPDES